MSFRKKFRFYSSTILDKLIKINESNLIVDIFNAKHLKYFGVSIVRNFMNTTYIPVDIEKAIDSIEDKFDFYEKVKSKDSKDPFSSGDYKKISFKNVRMQPYVKKNKTSYNGFDDGLIDIFNPHLNLETNNWLYKLHEIVKEKFENNNKIKAMKMNYTHSNLYIYRNVQSPRCLHFDSYRKQFKLFIALNPSVSKELGCYCYIPFSHKKPLIFLQYLGSLINNLVKNSDLGFYPNSDSTLFNISNSIPILTNSGDAVLTCQAGVHGDYPSVNPSNRFILVLNYLAN